MTYGLIGGKLAHSFSKEIHAKIAPYDYALMEIRPEELEKFCKERDFNGINVTIPYKQTIMQYLDQIDEHAARIHAVNTVINRDGKLIGYNADYRGAAALIQHAHIPIRDQNIMILGTGGTSHTMRCVVADLGAANITIVSRHPKIGEIGYDDVKKACHDVHVIINTTPVGMYPHTQESPVDLRMFPSLHGVIDAIYNPLRTPLIRQTTQLGLKAEGGLYMLAAQAVYASALFFNTQPDPQKTEQVYHEVLREKENIVLTGMPSSGKSTIGTAIAERLGRTLFDTDREIEKRCQSTISAIFATHGESCFRDLERSIIQELSDHQNLVIATGGGAVLDSQNIDALRANGRIYFLDRPLELLQATSDRPLSSDRNTLAIRYRERYEKYCNTADVRIDASGSVENVTQTILKEHNK